MYNKIFSFLFLFIFCYDGFSQPSVLTKDTFNVTFDNSKTITFTDAGSLYINNFITPKISILDSIIKLPPGSNVTPSLSWDNGNMGFYLQGSGQVNFVNYLSRITYWYQDGFGTFQDKQFELGGKVFLRDEGNNIGAQRNGLNSQTWRIYNTYSSSTNFERLCIKWDSNELIIGTEIGSSGILRDIYLKNLKSTIGSKSPNFGSNCPADDPREPYEWIQVEAKDGTPRYIPAWK